MPSPAPNQPSRRRADSTATSDRTVRARWLALAVTLLAVATLTACAASGPRQPPVPIGERFFQSPTSFHGQVVRLTRLRTERVDPTRPLLFAAYDAPTREVTVNDARGLSRQRNIRLHQVVTVVFRCTEGELDRGNLLVSIE